MPLGLTQQDFSRPREVNRQLTTALQESSADKRSQVSELTPNVIIEARFKNPNTIKTWNNQELHLQVSGERPVKPDRLSAERESLDLRHARKRLALKTAENANSARHPPISLKKQPKPSQLAGTDRPVLGKSSNPAKQFTSQLTKR